jgi:heterodisulfide reductase subunit B
MTSKDFNHLLDKYLSTGKMFPSEYEELDDLQRYVIQEIKRSLSRLKTREVCEIHHSLTNNNNEN